MEVAANLHSLAVKQLEKLEQNSSNSSLPPSSDRFKSKEKLGLEEKQQAQESELEAQTEVSQEDKIEKEENIAPKSTRIWAEKALVLQPGAKGMWRTTPLVPSQTIPHYPETCASCNSTLEIDPQVKPYIPHSAPITVTSGYY